MNFIKLIYNNEQDYYSYENASSIEMNILGNFLNSDVRCEGRNFFRNWILSNENEWAVSGNTTVLEKEGDFIYLTDQYPTEGNSVELKINKNQLIKLLDDWQEKVCKIKPKEVIINHENDQYIIETS